MESRISRGPHLGKPKHKDYLFTLCRMKDLSVVNAWTKIRKVYVPVPFILHLTDLGPFSQREVPYLFSCMVLEFCRNLAGRLNSKPPHFTFLSCYGDSASVNIDHPLIKYRYNETDMSRMGTEPRSPEALAGTLSRSYLTRYIFKVLETILKRLHFHVLADFF